MKLINLIYDVTANWSGAYPNVCSGEWTISVNGKNFPVPADKKVHDMGTAGTYDTWHFDDNYREVFDTYEDGVHLIEWVEKNRDWLDKSAIEIGMKPSDALYVAIFQAVQLKDWRSGSCGGCI
jgi:hypothetical protein